MESLVTRRVKANRARKSYRETLKSNIAKLNKMVAETQELLAALNKELMVSERELRRATYEVSV